MSFLLQFSTIIVNVFLPLFWDYVIQQRLAQHCKSTILQLNLNMYFFVRKHVQKILFFSKKRRTIYIIIQWTFKFGHLCHDMGQELATSCWSRELATQLFPILLSDLLDEEKSGQALVLVKIALSLKQTKLLP